MILFLADHPDNMAEQDGMAQRITAIDRSFANQERAYLKVSLLRNLKGETMRFPDQFLIIHRLNLFLHLLCIIAVIRQSSCLYIHSVGNALALMPAILFKKTVTDLHGLVSDEFSMAGNWLAALRYRLVERFVFRYSDALVVVSEAMAELLQLRYTGLKARIFRVPIFDSAGEALPPCQSSGDEPLLIYAGGAQAWQNVDLMLDSFKLVANFCRLRVLTADQEAFRDKIKQLGLEERVELLTVPKQEVYRHYAEAQFGFVLRDDLPVNRVACPTKLVEYLTAGLIPIVIQPDIGDFQRRGYASLSLEQLLTSGLPDQKELTLMREQNYQVVHNLQNDALEELSAMVAFCSREQVSEQ